MAIQGVSRKSKFLAAWLLTVADLALGQNPGDFNNSQGKNSEWQYSSNIHHEMKTGVSINPLLLNPEGRHLDFSHSLQKPSPNKSLVSTNVQPKKITPSIGLDQDQSQQMEIQQGKSGAYFLSQTPRKIVINLTSNQLSYYENGTLMDRWNVGTARLGKTTPTGFFYVREKEKCPPYFGSRGDHNTPGCTPANPFGPRILWFIGHLYGVHGTNQEYLIDSNSSPSSRRVSGGCIRNPNQKILWLFDRIEVGDPIEIVR